MSFCWLKRRGKVFHLHFAKKVGRKPFSLRTTDRALALEAMRREESAIWLNERGIKRKVVERLRYSDLLKRFVEHKRAAGINPETLKSYLRTLNRFGSFMQSDLFIDAITPEHLEAFITQRRTSVRHCDVQKPDAAGRLLKPKSIRNEALTFTTLFNWACDRSLLEENPTKKMCKPQRVVYDSQRALTPSEYLSLKSYIGENYRDVLDLYLLTGLRRSDGLQLTSENFNFEERVATFFQSKTKRHKTLPLSNDLAEVARRLIAKVGLGHPLVQVKPSALTRNFRKARIRSGLSESITFHSLRHSFASWLAQAGVDFKTLQSLTGHRSSQALEIYLHSFDPNRRTAIELLRLPKAANG